MSSEPVQDAEPTRHQPASVNIPLNEMTAYEILSGILLYLGPVPFTGQLLMEFISTLESDYPGIAQRFEIRGAYGAFRSSDVERALSFMDTYRILEPRCIEAPENWFRFRAAMFDSIRDKLSAEGMLPKHNEFLSRIAERFRTFLQNKRAH